jgi:hypothetical protein
MFMLWTLAYIGITRGAAGAEGALIPRLTLRERRYSVTLDVVTALKKTASGKNYRRLDPLCIYLC